METLKFISTLAVMIDIKNYGNVGYYRPDHGEGPRNSYPTTALQKKSTEEIDVKMHHWLHGQAIKATAQPLHVHIVTGSLINDENTNDPTGDVSTRAT